MNRRPQHLAPRRYFYRRNQQRREIEARLRQDARKT
jgi:hypothetical protein